MNNSLVNFLTGELAVEVKTAEEMKTFVDWLKKFDIQELLVGNYMYEKNYYKISFWKDIVKQLYVKGWIHPSRLKVIFFYHAGKGIDCYLFKEDMYKWWGEIDIIKPQELERNDNERD